MLECLRKQTFSWPILTKTRLYNVQLFILFIQNMAGFACVFYLFFLLTHRSTLLNTSVEHCFLVDETSDFVDSQL